MGVLIKQYGDTHIVSRLLIFFLHQSSAGGVDVPSASSVEGSMPEDA
jgi:hypothetical protein